MYLLQAIYLTSLTGTHVKIVKQRLIFRNVTLINISHFIFSMTRLTFNIYRLFVLQAGKCRSVDK